MPDSLTTSIKHEAQRLGFALSGVCAASPPPGYGRFQEWLASGYAGQMSFLPDRAEAYRDPQHVLAGARSVVMLAMNYHSQPAVGPRAGQGRVSRYAWGESDYHDLIHERLGQLADFVRSRRPQAAVRGVVDTAPLLEREFAQLAGLGWIGKNTLLLNRQAGSWFFLAALLTDLELECDEPFDADHCGTCRACLDACPTDAFVEPYVLDATRCISYLTIELRGPIPAHLREGMEDWLFGCDVCQEVCPWNSKASNSKAGNSKAGNNKPRASGEPAFEPREELNPIDARRLFALDDESFRARFRRTPLWRSKRRGILRNAAIVLGNRPDEDSIDALALGLNDAEPLVRGASAWALGRHPWNRARVLLAQRQQIEDDAAVLEEVAAALEVVSGEW
jgi:epoxyqueuosine reductase